MLHRRYPNVSVLVYPAQVQGDLAAADIAKGVQVLNRLGGFDVLIVTPRRWLARGSLALQRGVRRARHRCLGDPGLSAVGHEIDFTIADFVADLRAPTPSAAAEMVARSKEEFRDRVDGLSGRLESSLRARIVECSNRLERLASHRAFAAVLHGVEMKGQRLDEASYRARSTVERNFAQLDRRLRDLGRRLEATRVDRRLADTKSQLARLATRLEAAERVRVAEAERRTGRLAAKLDALSPLAVLARGYSLTWSTRGKLLRRAVDAEIGEEIRVDLSEGGLRCRVEALEPARRASEDVNAEH